MEFAISEFNKYWEKAVGAKHEVSLRLFDSNEIAKNSITDVTDAYRIEIFGRKGYIAGSNECALLIGVYAFFHKLGCRFVQPKVDIIVNIKESDISINEYKKATNRFRGVTIEGATSVNQLLDLIDWLPKVGFNSYFTQFKTSYEFFERWYSHKNNPTLAPEPFNMQLAEHYYNMLEQAMQLRGLKHHAVGHGWTCECLGIDSMGWRKFDGTPKDLQPDIALLNGKREFFKGIPLNTNLCYSNAQASEKFCAEVLKYAMGNSVDFLHIWLADDYNNFCECPDCKAKSPTDWYVTLLNRIDELLTQNGLKTKIVFLIYYELMWPPKTCELKNQDRFVLMFAPISRSYSKSFSGAVNLSQSKNIPLEPYEFNKIKPSANLQTNLSYLFEWQKHFKGDSFAFDYHLMWDINKELSGLRLSEVLYDDVQFYNKLGLGGYMSCQLQRAFFPLGLPFYLLGRCLFDGELTYNQIKTEYFEACYGSCAAEVENIYNVVRENLPHEYFRAEIDEINSEVAEKAKKLVEFINIKKDKIKISGTDGNIFTRQLNHALRMYELMGQAVQVKAEGQSDQAISEKVQNIVTYMQNAELEFQTIVDVYYFVFTVNEIFKHHWGKVEN